MNYVLEEEQIDTIMHFAAQTHVGKQMQCLMYTLVDQSQESVLRCGYTRAALDRVAGML